MWKRNACETSGISPEHSSDFVGHYMKEYFLAGDQHFHVKCILPVSQFVEFQEMWGREWSLFYFLVNFFSNSIANILFVFVPAFFLFYFSFIFSAFVCVSFFLIAKLSTVVYKTIVKLSRAVYTVIRVQRWASLEFENLGPKYKFRHLELRFIETVTNIFNGDIF